MSGVGEADIRRLAKLTRLALDDEEVKTARAAVDGILRMMDTLRRANVDGIDALSHIQGRVLVCREDEARAGLAREDFLRNAPRAADGYFLTPKVIE